jgi:hypothetical protein
MNNLQTINLSDLERRFYVSTSAQHAIIWLAVNKSNEPYLDEVLRNHFEEPIEDREAIRFRDALDSLLDFYSQLEIANLADFIHQDSVLWYRYQVESVLGNPIVAKYYCDRYPLLLPQLFLARIRGRFLTRYQSTDAIPLYLEILDICRPIYENSDVQLFLDCVDDYILWQGDDQILSFDLILQAIENPNDYLQRLFRPRDQQELLDKALLGFINFIEFCQSFHGLLERSADLELLQSAIWHNQSYWFKTLRKTRNAGARMNNAIGLFSKWRTMLETGDDSFTETQNAIEGLQQILADLFSDRYERPLIQAAKEQGVIVHGFDVTF